MKMKRAFSLLISLALISLALCMGISAADGEIDIDFGVIIGGVASGSIGDNLSWTLDGYGVLSVSGEGDMPDFSEDDVPWAEHADSVKTVVIGNGVTSVGENAFYGMSLENIKIPASVEQIGEGALENAGSGLTVYATSESYALSYAEERGYETKLAGDIDNNKSVDIDDAVYLLQHSLFSDAYPITDYAMSVDLDVNNSIDLDDAVLLLQHSLFPEVYPI